MAVITYEEVKNNPALRKHAALFLMTSILSRKWNVILLTLLRETSRFNELKKSIPDISPTNLSRALKELEEVGFITRNVYGGYPPNVEYVLTETGKELIEILDVLERWGIEYVSRSDLFRLPDDAD